MPALMGMMVLFFISSLMILLRNQLDWANPLLIIVPAIILLVSILSFNQGQIELENDVLLFRRFFVMWSINISDITDIMFGNTVASSRGSSAVPGIDGLSFRTKNGNFYQFSNNLLNCSFFIDGLKTINPLIKIHKDILDVRSFADFLGWKGDTRGRRKKMIMFVIVFLVVSIAMISVGLDP